MNTYNLHTRKRRRLCRVAVAVFLYLLTAGMAFVAVATLAAGVWPYSATAAAIALISFLLARRLRRASDNQSEDAS